MTYDENDWPPGVIDALRRDAARAPSFSAEEAARRVRARIASPRPARRRWLLPAAVTAAVLIALSSVTRTPIEPPAAPPASAEVVIGPLPENVVLWWLDPETPVYFVLSPPAPAKGGSS